MSRKEVELVFHGKDDGASTVVDHIAQRLKLMKKEAAATGENALKKTLAGPEGILGAAADMAGIGIEVMAIGQLADMAERASAKILEIRDSLSGAKMEASDVAGEFARSIPVLGQMVSFWDNIIELVSGATEKAKRFEEVSEAQVEAQAINRKRAMALQDEMRDAKFGNEKANIANSGQSDIDTKVALRQAEAAEANRRLWERINEETDTGQKEQLKGLVNTQAQRDTAETQKIYKDAKREAVRIEAEGNQQVEDIRSQAQALALREAGESTEAELETIRRAGERKNAELRRQKADEDQKFGPKVGQAERDQRLTAAVMANDQLTRTQEAAAKRAGEIQERDKTYEVNRALQSQKNVELQEKSALSVEDRRAAIKARAEQESDARLQAMQKILDDKDATKAQKDDAQAEMSSESARQRRRMKWLDEENLVENRRGVSVTTGLGSRFHDIAGQYANGGEPALMEQKATSKNTGKSAVHLEDIAKATAALLAAFQKGLSIRGRALAS